MIGLFLSQEIMKVNGKTFDGSTHFLDTYRRLSSIAGNECLMVYGVPTHPISGERIYTT